MKQFAIGIIISTTIFMSIFIYGLFVDPIDSIKQNWEVYLIFVFFPYSVAALLLFFWKRARRGADE
jgi:Na+/proline symporter